MKEPKYLQLCPNYIFTTCKNPKRHDVTVFVFGFIIDLVFNIHEVGAVVVNVLD